MMEKTEMSALFSSFLGNRSAASALGGLAVAWVSVALTSDFTTGGALVLALA